MVALERQLQRRDIFGLMINMYSMLMNVSGLQQRILKSQLVSLASRQRSLMEILQKQLHLVEAYVTMKTKLNSQPSDHFSTLASTKRREEHGSRSKVFISPSPNNELDRVVPRPPAPVLTQTKKIRTRTCLLRNKASSCHSSTSQAGNTLPHVNVRTKGKNVQIQTQAGDKSRHLSTLIQRGIMPSGSALELLMKGQWHRALVNRDGSIKDRKGKLHLTPERWLESVLGNNIPVSSAYAWDKVLFREKCLSHYLFNMEAEGNSAQAPPEGGVQHCTAASSQQTLATEAAGLTCLMRVKIIHLVDDEEVFPNAVLDSYWERLLQTDYSEPEDWWSTAF